MKYLLISFISLVLSTVFYILSICYSNKDIYTKAKSKNTCSSTGDTSENTCGIWEPDEDICVKGTCETCQGECTPLKHSIVLISFIATSITFISFILFAILGAIK
jgi:hypothetical protein